MSTVKLDTYMLNDEDAKKIRELIKVNEESVNYFNEIVQGVVDKYCKFIDDLMREIEGKVSNIKYPITDDDLDYYILKLPNALFFCGEALVALGVKKDMAKADRVAKYNKEYMKTSGTIGDKDTKASSETKDEQIIEALFDRSAKRVQQRVEAGYEMLSSMKKVLSRRMSAYQMSGVQSGRIAPMNGYKNNNGDNE